MITYFNTWHLLHNMLIFHYPLWVLMLCEFTTTDGAASVPSLTLIIHQASLLSVAEGAYFYEAWFQSPVIADNSKWMCGNTECVSVRLSVFFTLIVLWLLIVVCCLQHSSLTMKAIDNGWLSLCLHERGTAPNSFRWVQWLCGILMSGVPFTVTVTVTFMSFCEIIQCHVCMHFVYPRLYFLFLPYHLQVWLTN